MTRNYKQKVFGQVLTPVEMIDLMIKQDADYILDPKTRVMDNSCGTGNFLVRILERRIERGIDPITAISTLYGMEIQEENYLITKARLKSYLPADTDYEPNIIHADALKTPQPPFDLLIGNPPFNQVAEDGRISASIAYYTYFLDFIKTAKPKKASLIIPLRFLISSKKPQTIKWREFFLNSPYISQLHLFPSFNPFLVADKKQTFSNKEDLIITGGVFFFYYDTLSPFSSTLINEYLDQANPFVPTISAKRERYLEINSRHSFIPNLNALKIIKKVEETRRLRRMENLRDDYYDPERFPLQPNQIRTLFYNKHFLSPQYEEYISQLLLFPADKITEKELVLEDNSPSALHPSIPHTLPNSSFLSPANPNGYLRILGRDKNRKAYYLLKNPREFFKNYLSPASTRKKKDTNTAFAQQTIDNFYNKLLDPKYNYGYKVFNSFLVGQSNLVPSSSSYANPIPVRVLPKPLIGFPEDICTGSYFPSNTLPTLAEAYCLKTYLSSKLVRFLIKNFIGNITLDQDTIFEKIPTIPAGLLIYAKSYPITLNPLTLSMLRKHLPQEKVDRFLYKFYQLTEEEIAYINTQIKDYE